MDYPYVLLNQRKFPENSRNMKKPNFWAKIDGIKFSGFEGNLVVFGESLVTFGERRAARKVGNECQKSGVGVPTKREGAKKVGESVPKKMERVPKKWDTHTFLSAP